MIERFIYFLKELPAWAVLTTIFFVVFAAYISTGLPFLERIVDTVLGGVLTATIGTILRKGTTVQADTVQTPSINNENMTATIEVKKESE